MPAIVSALVETYPDNSITSQLRQRNEIAPIRSLDLLLHSRSALSLIMPETRADFYATLYCELDRSESRESTEQLVQRLLCLAFSSFHLKGTNTQDSISSLADHDFTRYQD